MDLESKIWLLAGPALVRVLSEGREEGPWRWEMTHPLLTSQRKKQRKSCDVERQNVKGLSDVGTADDDALSHLASITGCLEMEGQSPARKNGCVKTTVTGRRRESRKKKWKSGKAIICFHKIPQQESTGPNIKAPCKSNQSFQRIN